MQNKSISGKVVLCTGGTGTFGRAFAEHVLAQNPKQLRVFSRDELKQSQMADEIRDSRVEYLLGDIRDFDRLRVALRGVDVCIHAAALKRVEKGQRDPQEFIKTNVTGTINVANACLENNVSVAIFISSDKAVAPINVYGGSKFLAEQVWINSNVYRGSDRQTKLAVVRYGNVIGSRGSLLRIWTEQAKQGFIEITDPRMTRFFIPLRIALRLVDDSIATLQGGEIFIPEIKSAKISDLTSLVPVPVKVVGNRGGEKTHEVLVSEDEFSRLVNLGTYSIISPANPTWSFESPAPREPKIYVTSETADKLTPEELRRLFQNA